MRSGGKRVVGCRLGLWVMVGRRGNGNVPIYHGVYNRVPFVIVQIEFLAITSGPTASSFGSALAFDC